MVERLVAKVRRSVGAKVMARLRLGGQRCLVFYSWCKTRKAATRLGDLQHLRLLVLVLLTVFDLVLHKPKIPASGTTDAGAEERKLKLAF